ncbi:hypothetical protein ACWCQ0_39190 [Streptomyces massasporeus]|uniref:hypothetical protein n=1 Tax=Streptomyces massasporeus TaxID=67324 RepID=UPI0034059999
MSVDTLPWWAVVYAFAGAVAGSWWLTGRERGAAVVVGATVVTQGLLHLLFELAHRLARAPAAATGVPGAEGTSGTEHWSAVSHTGMVMQHAGSMGMPSDSPLPSGMAQFGLAGMVVAHLLAAVVCGLWLWRGEAATHRIGRALAVALFAPLRRVWIVLFSTMPGAKAPSRGPAFGTGEHRPPAPSLLRHAVVRRGPPRGRSPVKSRVFRSAARRTAVISA